MKNSHRNLNHRLSRLGMQCTAVSSLFCSVCTLLLMSLTRCTVLIYAFLSALAKALTAHGTRAKGALLLRAFGIDVHAKVTPGAVFRVAAPVLSVLLLCCTVFYWSSRSYGLSVSMDGEVVVTVEKEAVFESASTRLNNQVSHEDENDISYYTTPMYAITVGDASAVSNAEGAYASLRQQTSDVLQEGYGLYVDGTLYAAMTDKAQLDTALDTYSRENLAGHEDAQISFSQNVEVISGLYASSGFTTDTALLEKLNSREIVLDVVYTQYTVRQQALAYGADIREDSTKYNDYYEVISAGVDGVQECTDKLTYVNGVLGSTSVVSTKTLVEPVDEVVVVGTQIRPDGSQPGVPSGILSWPSYSMYTITTYHTTRWGAFHYGIDLWCSGCYGEPIVASDAGTVVWAGNKGNGYGNYVMIDHGNGVKTLYAHASSVAVKVGDPVAKGQVIAYVGSTGNSTGAHLHFEVLINGVSCNPLDYISTNAAVCYNPG